MGIIFCDFQKLLSYQHIRQLILFNGFYWIRAIEIHGFEQYYVEHTRRERARCIPILCKGLTIILLEGGWGIFFCKQFFWYMHLCNLFFFPKSPAWKHFFSGVFFFSVIGYYKLINIFFRETIDSAIATYFLHICSGAEGVSSWVSESFRRDIGQFCSPRNESLANRRISSSLDFNLESFSYIKTYLLWKLWPISL